VLFRNNRKGTGDGPAKKNAKWLGSSTTGGKQHGQLKHQFDPDELDLVD
jgi:hypothetical protein